MSIACPYCKAVINLKGAKPGKYTPKCPKCGNPFILVVPQDETGTFRVQSVQPKKPAAEPPDTVRTPAVKPSVQKPATDKLPATSSRPPSRTASPTADTGVLVKGSGTVKPPPARPLPTNPASVEDVAAALLEGKDPGDIAADPDAADNPGDGTEPPKNA